MSLYEACLDGDLEEVKRIFLDQSNTLQDVLEAPDDDGWTLIHHAVRGGHVDVVRYLVETAEEGGSSDLLDHVTTTEDGLEALFFAISDGHLDMVKYMAENGGEKMMDTENDSEMRPLHFASLEGDYDIVRYLVEEHDVDVEAQDNDGWTPLHYASLVGSLDTVRFLAEEHDADCEVVDKDGWTPLHCAAKNGNVDVAHYLIEEQLVEKHTLTTDDDSNALHLAARAGRLEMMKYFVEDCGFDVSQGDSDGDGALHTSARYGMLNAVKYLVERLDAATCLEIICTKNNTGQTAYDIAAMWLEADDERYANQEVVYLLHSYVAPMAVPADYDDDDDVCVKLNPDLCDNELDLAQQCLKTVAETEVHEVAYHILGYLCLSDVKYRAER